MPPIRPDVEPVTGPVPTGTPLIDTLLPPLARVILRYLIGALVGVGVLTVAQGEAMTADPQLQLALTVILGGAASWLVERAYALARRYGGRT